MLIIDIDAAIYHARYALTVCVTTGARPVVTVEIGDRLDPTARRHVVVKANDVAPRNHLGRRRFVRRVGGATPPRFRPRDPRGRFVSYASFGASLLASSLGDHIELVPSEGWLERILHTHPAYVEFLRCLAVDTETDFIPMVTALLRIDPQRHQRRAPRVDGLPRLG
ncbi:hypothetical protein K8Z61_12625 [Nocardioides sp. TRM66260-LWL]|uniref:hypothetical protein n=1 Tax=Nocardioides sp. TRM66260-LWL TaxID=2874478 RepID=UPI001CC626F2|nr:hypothetical protein [Nocardioides sp. TRM66260-LWL]MBZ5735341.1 hypothetical protein [Nocardioides sp. TRM66260-LWL]